MSATLIFLLGSIFGGLGVILGAFASHVLKTNLSAEQLTSFETGVRYQMYHSLALILVSYGMRLEGGEGLFSMPALLPLAGLLFVFGILLFSGSLYLLVATGVRRLGIVTPFGGLALIGGWLCLAFAVL